MKAIVVQEPGRAAVVDVEEPAVRPDYFKVKNIAVGLNPTDWRHIDSTADKGCVVGCDYAGIVVAVGESCKSEVKVGDKIWGSCHGGNNSNHQDGAFGEFCVQKEGVCAKMSENLSFEQGASLGVGVTSIAQALYQSLGFPMLPAKVESPTTLLVYGGSSTTGMLAIQYAKLSGLTVVTTASPHNFDLVTSLGADKVFDYTQSDCGSAIREYTNNELRYVFDTISVESSFKICAEALSSSAEPALHFTGLLPVEMFPRKDVNTRMTLAYTASGESFFKFGMTFPAIPADHEHATKFFALTAELLESGKIKPPPIEVGLNGLDGVLEGIQRLRENKVRAKKLVYKIADEYKMKNKNE